MEINDSKDITSLGQRTTPARTKKPGATEPLTIANTGPAPDSVTLSGQAQALAAAAGTGQVFDARKVEEIRSAIASGQFRVDPEKVAQGLMDTVRDLISTRRKE